MNSQELETAVCLGLPLVILIWRDNGYGVIRGKQVVRFRRIHRWISAIPILCAMPRVSACSAIPSEVRNMSRCLVPAFDGVLFSHQWKDALWDKYFTGAPARQRRCVGRSNRVKKA